VRADLEENSTLIQEEKQLAGRFILATNILDEGELSPDKMLFEYKEQQSTERGFRVLVRVPLRLTKARGRTAS